MKTIKSIRNEQDAFKAALFAEADELHDTAVDYYELSIFDVADDFANRFDGVLELMSHFGWDKEYMGIA